MGIIRFILGLAIDLIFLAAVLCVLPAVMIKGAIKAGTELFKRARKFFREKIKTWKEDLRNEVICGDRKAADTAA